MGTRRSLLLWRRMREFFFLAFRCNLGASMLNLTLLLLFSFHPVLCVQY